MKFENTEVYGFKSALRGMRNPLESWKKNDTVEENGSVTIGENDLGHSGYGLGAVFLRFFVIFCRYCELI